MSNINLMGRWLRNANPQLLAMEFMGPLLLWRHLHALGSELPAIRNWRASAQQHVDQLLQGAASDTNDAVSRVRAEEGRRPRRPAPCVGGRSEGHSVKSQKRHHEGACL